MNDRIIKQLKEIAKEKQHTETLNLLIDAWNNEDSIDSPIIGISNKNYAFRVLDILKNELKVQSPTILSTGYGLYQFFYNKKIKGIDPKIEEITEGFLSIHSLPTNNIENQAENYRAMVLNLASDLRALLIGMAINVLELRFINYINTNISKKQKDEILQLNKHVYIPIAHRLGFYKLKLGLEDIILKLEEEDAYKLIKSKLRENEEEREKIIKEFIDPIKQSLDEHGMKFIIKGRTKSVHSIFTKMKAQDIPFEKVYDLWAVRIIIDSKPSDEKASCWHAFSVVSNLYTPSLSRMRDWISVPRENGYESLHITVSTTDKRWVEVQIRTERMDDEAENGMAAHWRYKGGKDSFGIDFWLDNIKHALEKPDDTLLGKDEFRSNKFSTELFAYTPNGDLKKLKIGATILDFAFAVHSEVGLSCVGGKVNGKNVGIKHSLKNGDQVEVFTQKAQKPSLDWLNIVTTNRAKLHIRKAFDQEGKIEAEFGKDILLRKLRNWKLSFNQDILDELLSGFNFKAVSDLYRAFYNEKIDLSKVKALLLSDTEEDNTPSSEMLIEDIIDNTDDTANSSNDDLLVVDNMSNINYNLAKCCNPISGDKIFGFVTVSKGISIHRKNCPNALDMKTRYPYRIIPAIWKKQNTKHNFRAELQISGTDKNGIIAKLSDVLHTSLNVPILNINLNSDGTEFFGKLVVSVHDKEQLARVIEKLGELNIVGQVYRKS